jgi:hypothetical protein
MTTGKEKQGKVVKMKKNELLENLIRMNELSEAELPDIELPEFEELYANIVESMIPEGKAGGEEVKAVKASDETKRPDENKAPEEPDSFVLSSHFLEETETMREYLKRRLKEYLSVEHLLFKTEVLDMKDYPMIDPASLDELKKEFESDGFGETRVYVFQRFHKHKKYYDIYAFMEDIIDDRLKKVTKRFIITEGMRMDDESELDFEFLIRKDMLINPRLKSLNSHFRYLAWDYTKDYAEDLGSLALDKLYSTMNDRGPVTRLYEAGYDSLAFMLPRYDRINLKGETAAEIFGVDTPDNDAFYSMMNGINADVIENIICVNQLERCAVLFDKYHDILTEKPGPNAYQLGYLGELSFEYGIFYGRTFDKPLYDSFYETFGDDKVSGNFDDFFELYRAYYGLIRTCPEFDIIPAEPRAQAIRTANKYLLELIRKKFARKLNPEIETDKSLEYHGSEYSVIPVTSILTYYIDGVMLNNDAVRYSTYIPENTQVLLIRKNDAPDSPFGFITILDKCILNASGDSDRLLLGIYDFISEYAQNKGLKFNMLGVIRDWWYRFNEMYLEEDEDVESLDDYEDAERFYGPFYNSESAGSRAQCCINDEDYLYLLENCDDREVLDFLNMIKERVAPLIRNGRLVKEPVMKQVRLFETVSET